MVLDADELNSSAAAVVVSHQVFIAGFCSSSASKYGPINVLCVADCRVTVKGHNNPDCFLSLIPDI